jgi:hypothetical protein
LFFSFPPLSWSLPIVRMWTRLIPIRDEQIHKADQRTHQSTSYKPPL